MTKKQEEEDAVESAMDTMVQLEEMAQDFERDYGKKKRGKKKA